MVIGTKDKPSDTGYREVPNLFERISSITKGGEPFNRPTGVALSSTGAIYVADGYANARVHKFSSDGRLLFSWGEPGPGPGQFRLPHSIFIDKRDRIWVADRENSRIQIFDDKGNFLTQWTDHLIRPTDVFIDEDETVYVSTMKLPTRFLWLPMPLRLTPKATFTSARSLLPSQKWIVDSEPFRSSHEYERR
jgi:DNA-binding beta-propeller fold protein YncE